ncbi:hypothetical protein OESDEN_15761 [Oesophagostomum dentatum]|uniref:Uncharacterized protein n=1 Tax=Oesophagostomum dentatum TaxID=61180 RepID=A0A0B1SGR3_OESDE|nr:hypothetical protein OESDEN_15761 [Oesophagostomum dentatum]
MQHKNDQDEELGGPSNRPASLSSQAEAALAAAEIQSMRSDGTDPFALIVERNVQQEVKKRLGRPPKEHGLKIRLKGVKEKKEDTRQKRKYVRRRDKIAGGLHCLSPPAIENAPPKPAPQPLTEEEKKFEPCALEKRVRWWLSEKRRVDASPESADEAQSVNGSLDILMDSLMGSLGPLLTIASAAFENLIPDDLSQMLWNASSVHLPTFQ